LKRGKEGKDYTLPPEKGKNTDLLGYKERKGRKRNMVLCGRGGRGKLDVLSLWRKRKKETSHSQTDKEKTWFSIVW